MFILSKRWRDLIFQYKTNSYKKLGGFNHEIQQY